MYHILELLRISRIVKDVDILNLVDEDDIQAISAKALLADGSTLYIRELATNTETKYSYHWQAEDGRLICRWDNAPHHHNLPNFPHHKHKNGAVSPSEEITLDQAFRVIADRISRRRE